MFTGVLSIVDLLFLLKLAQPPELVGGDHRQDFRPFAIGGLYLLGEDVASPDAGNAVVQAQFEHVRFKE